MNRKWTLADIQQLISDGIEEDRGLEYKGAEALGKSDPKKNEISKDVSSFANANGGIIIYGVREFDEKEKQHKPEKIDPIKRTEFSKEWLEQIINNKIQPKIQGVEIQSIEVSQQDNSVIYVVIIPKGSTAHQASGHKYYKRYNFQADPMEDYEIRDVMNRLTHPAIVLDFEIETTIKKIEDTPNPMIGLTLGKSYKNIHSNTLKIFARNTGAVYANYVNYYVHLNADFLSTKEADLLRIFFNDSRKYAEYYGENTIRDVTGVGATLLSGESLYKYGPSRFDPILPGMHTRAEKLKLKQNIEEFADEIIYWKVYADNAPLQEGTIRIGDIKTIRIEND